MQAWLVRVWCAFLLYMFCFRHPMVVATALKARDFKDVIFVSDSILEPKPGAVVSYLERKSEAA